MHPLEPLAPRWRQVESTEVSSPRLGGPAINLAERGADHGQDVHSQAGNSSLTPRPPQSNGGAPWIFGAPLRTQAIKRSTATVSRGQPPPREAGAAEASAVGANLGASSMNAKRCRNAPPRRRSLITQTANHECRSCRWHHCHCARGGGDRRRWHRRPHRGARKRRHFDPALSLALYAALPTPSCRCFMAPRRHRP